MASKLSLVALEIAITQLGKKEIPKYSNWGHPVQDYLLRVGIDFPASWCMAFVYWCFDEAALRMEVPNLLYRTGGVLKAYNNSPVHHQHDAMVGDIFIQDHGHGLGHCGIVESVGYDYINTIDGNTNDTGSREGFEVERKKRLKSSIKGYLRY